MHPDDTSDSIPIAGMAESVTLDAALMPTVGLYVNVDLNDLLEVYNGDEIRLFELLGKLKDLFNA